jgi:hypothetical protein
MSFAATLTGYPAVHRMRLLSRYLRGATTCPGLLLQSIVVQPLHERVTVVDEPGLRSAIVLALVILDLLSLLVFHICRPRF